MLQQNATGLEPQSLVAQRIASRCNMAQHAISQQECPRSCAASACVSALRHALHRVGQELQACGLALFRVELDGHEVGLDDAGCEGGAVLGGAGDEAFVLHIGIVGVDEIHVAGAGEACGNGGGTGMPAGLVPAHVGDLEAGAGGKLAHAAGGDAEAFHTGRFLAAGEEELVAEADADVGAAFGEPGLEGIPELVLAQDAHAVAKGALAGEDEGVDALKIRRGGDELGGVADGGEGVEHAAQVAGAVVEYSEFHGRLQSLFRAEHAGDAGVVLGGLVHDLREAFEDRFGHVVGILAADDFDVEVGEGKRAEAAHELLHKLEVEADADGVHTLGHGVDEQGAAAEVDGEAGERFVHGQEAPAVAADAFLLAEGVAEALAQHDAHVLDGVVEVHLGVAGGVDGEVKEPVLGEQGKHVVEEGHAGLDLAATGAVHVQFHADVCLRGLAVTGGGAGGARHKRVGN